MAPMNRLVLGAILVIGVVLPGLADYLLSAAGYPTVGAAFWAGGYALMVLVVWYGWIRPLDLRGPTG